MLMMFLYEARALYRSIISKIGNPFLPNWDQEGQKPKKSHQSKKPKIRPCRRGPGRSPCLEVYLYQPYPKREGLGPKILQTSLRAGGICCWSACEFWSGLRMESGRGPGRNGGPMMPAKKVGSIGTTPYWGPVSPFARFLGCLCPLGKHETGLACIAQAKPYKMCMLHDFWARFAHTSTVVAPKLVQCVKLGCYVQLICKNKMQSWARKWSAK